ncbi:MAG: phosphodiester glycosidase family protein [Pseudomonadota bacterium]
MKTRLRRASAILGLLAVAAGCAAETPACREIVFEDTPFAVCEASAKADLRLFLRDDAGEPHGEFRSVDDALAEEGRRLAFAMNAGMYHQDRAPVGLYIEAGEKAASLNTKDGPGNFHLMPNGVFFIADGTAAVLESNAFVTADPDVDYATQSGPMLVVDGTIHPKFNPDSSSYKRRNGVGVSTDGETVYFVISDQLVTFHRFARLFRDELGCDNALFLDGAISRLHAPELGRSEIGARMGPIVGLVEAVAE